MIEAHIEGLKGFKAHAKKTHKESQKALGQALVMGALLLQRESQKIVPVDTTTLKKSANDGTRLEEIGGQPSVTVGYGTDYAIYVHENMEARHAPGKTAKFLTRPMEEKKGAIIKTIENTYNRLVT
jgi:hypothetical protein